MPVLDASCAIELVLDRGGKAEVLSALGGKLAEAPEIIQLETLQTLRGLVRGGKVPLARDRRGPAPRRAQSLAPSA